MTFDVSDRLTFATSRELLAFFDGRRGDDGVLRRQSFLAEDLRRWVGGIGILQWRAEQSDYVYRLFGTHLAQNLGRDLTGLTLAEWPVPVAAIMRAQANDARRRGVAVVSHYRLRVFRRKGVVENGVRTQEKVVVPLAYSIDGEPDAVLVYVDQRFADIPILRPHMDATDGSCWCAGDRPVCVGCPLGGGTSKAADQILSGTR